MGFHCSHLSFLSVFVAFSGIVLSCFSVSLIATPPSTWLQTARQLYAAARSLNVEIALISCFVANSLELQYVDRCTADGVRGFLNGCFLDKIYSKNTGITGYKQMSAAGRQDWSNSGSQRSPLRVKVNKAGGRGKASRWQFRAAVNKEKSNSALFPSAGKVKAVSPKPRAACAPQKHRQSSFFSFYHGCAPPFVQDSRDRKQFRPQWKCCFWKANKYGSRRDYFYQIKTWSWGNDYTIFSFVMKFDMQSPGVCRSWIIWIGKKKVVYCCLNHSCNHQNSLPIVQRLLNCAEIWNVDRVNKHPPTQKQFSFQMLIQRFPVKVIRDIFCKFLSSIIQAIFVRLDTVLFHPDS